MDPPSRSEGWPRPGGKVVVIYDADRRIPAEVTSATALSLRLRLAQHERDPNPGGSATGATLEYVAGDRAYRLSGRVEGREPDGQLRFIPRSKPLLLQRRDHMRVPVEIVIVLTAGEGTAPLVGLTRNVGTGGALAHGFDRLPSIGERLRFSLVSRVGSEVLKGTCRVMRHDPGGEVAVAFEDVTPYQLEQLADFILRHRGRRG